MKEKIIVLSAHFILALACLAGCTGSPKIVTEADSTDEVNESQAAAEEVLTDTEEINEVYVYVVGNVKNPDVYKVPEDYRIYQVIELAGGFTEEAETGSINLADHVYDGMKLTVYAVGEEISETYGQAAQADGKININTASKEELITLPGIGDAKAESIISYRNENGYFNSIEDIMNISGIKEGAFEKIKEYITV